MWVNLKLDDIIFGPDFLFHVLNLNRCKFHFKKKDKNKAVKKVHIRQKFRKWRLKKNKSAMQNKIDASLEDEFLYCYF